MENTNTTKTPKSRPASFEELYAAKDYKGAINFLLQNKQHFDSGTFHYNLGTTYAKLGEFGAARFNLEKALENGMYNSATLNNLSFVQSKIDAEDLSTSTSAIDQVIHYSLKIPSEAYLSTSLFILLIFLIMIKIKKITNKMVITIFILIALIPFTLSKSWVASLNPAVALKEISVYEGPSKVFQEKGKIRPGAKIVLGEFKDGWYFVKYPINLSGWVNKDNLGIF